MSHWGERWGDRLVTVLLTAAVSSFIVVSILYPASVARSSRGEAIDQRTDAILCILTGAAYDHHVGITPELVQSCTGQTEAVTAP